MRKLILRFVMCAMVSICFSSLSNESPLPVQKTWRGKHKEQMANDQSETFMPTVSNETIICGSKRVELKKEGTMRVMNSGGAVLAEIYPYRALKNKKTGKMDWNSFTKDECSMTADGNRFVWKLQKKTTSGIWTAAEQILELQPDGLIVIRTTFKKSGDADYEPRKGEVFIMLPYSTADRTSVIFNKSRKNLTSDGKTFVFSKRPISYNYVFYPDSPSNIFSLISQEGKCERTVLITDKFNKSFRTVFETASDGSAELILDIRKGVKPSVSVNQRGGVDFKAVENLNLPDHSHKNLLGNASFERGLHSWLVGMAFGHTYDPAKWDSTPYFIDASERHSGLHSLRLLAKKKQHGDDYRNLKTGNGLVSRAVVLEPGKYTFSVYAKCRKGENALLECWVPNFNKGSAWLAIPGGKAAFPLVPEWKRYSMTFDVPGNMPLTVYFSASASKDSYVWLDSLQLEKGNEATAFEQRCAEGRLVTSAEDNFISEHDKIDASMVVTTAKKNSSGLMTVCVKNFFGESVFRRTISFKTDSNGVAEVKLDFDSIKGLGLFTVRTDYMLDDGSKTFEMTRFTRINPQKKRHRLSSIFCETYLPPIRNYNFKRILERWRKVGYGSIAHLTRYDREPIELFLTYGIEPVSAFMASYYGKGLNLSGFGICDMSWNDYRISKDDPRWLIKDYKVEGGGKLTPEYLGKFRDAAKYIAAKYPQITTWAFGGEVMAKFSADWWSPYSPCEAYAKILKAFVDGVKAGNPAAKVFQDDPCNMRPTGGIAETDELLAECNKLGVKFDLIAIHPYRESPESPDLDSDTEKLLSVLDKRGYGKTPVIWPEGMHWGPFEIPAWGIKAARWGATPQRGTWTWTTLSYDIGWTEKRTAAWCARAWLVALKYSDRVKCFTAGIAQNGVYLDELMTPYANQIVANTLGHLLGDSYFKKDIRFAPYIRAYIFEDAQKRPVAAVWCHLDDLDNGSIDAPVAEADFGSSLESVFDMMNTSRTFSKGKFRFPVTSFPVFFRGKPGTLDKMIQSFEKATIVSGFGSISPVSVQVNPSGGDKMCVVVKNFVSNEFSGTLNGHHLKIPASGISSFTIPLPEKLSADKITRVQFNAEIKSDSGSRFSSDLSFEGITAKQVPENAEFSSFDWNVLPQVPFTKNYRTPGTSGAFRIGWNKNGLFAEITVKDRNFVHVEYPKIQSRYKNDCVQLYIDTMANGRARSFKGYDEDDYDYALYPNAKGDSSIVYRNRSVESQLGLATAAPKDDTVASDIPSTFSNHEGLLTYRVFLPAKYLLPMKLEKGWVFGLGLFVPNSDSPGNVKGALTLASDGGGCYNRPHTWPAVVLTE